MRDNPNILSTGVKRHKGVIRMHCYVHPLPSLFFHRNTAWS